MSDKKLLQAMSKILLPMFSSKIFMVLGLTFKSLIHFVYGVIRWSGFIFLHLSVQFFQYYLLNRLFAPLYVLAPSVEY